MDNRVLSSSALPFLFPVLYRGGLQSSLRRIAVLLKDDYSPLEGGLGC